MPSKKKSVTKKKVVAKKPVAKKAVVEVISVANLCRTNEIDPKKGRARLRKQGWSAKGKTYPPIEVGSTRYVEACEILGIA